MSMKKYSLKPILTLACMLVCLAASAQVKLPVVLDKVPFFITNSTNRYTSAEPLLYYITKGTEVTVYGYMWWHEETELHVELADGSMGFIPTIAVAFNKDIYYEATPTEYYRLVGVGDWIDKDGNPSLVPSFYKYKDQNGRIQKKEKDWSYYDESRKRMMHGALVNFYDKYPSLLQRSPILQDEPLMLELKDGELPLTYLGCSRTYIESILGRSLGYAGPQLADNNGYSYAFYDKVIWKVADRMDAGLIIIYDKDMRAIGMKKYPLDWTYGHERQLLYTPFAPVADIDTVGMKGFDFHGIRTVKGENSSKSFEAPSEATTPPLYDSIRIKSMYIFENLLGVRNRWVIFAILVALSWFISSVVQHIIVRLRLSCSDMCQYILHTILVIPVIVFALIYAARFRPIVMLIAWVLIICSMFPTYLKDKLNYNRCRKCHQWIEPIVVERREGRPSVVSRPNIQIGLGVLIESQGGERVWNYNTSIKIKRDVCELVKCPLCGEIMEHNRCVEEKIIGPEVLVVYDRDGKVCGRTYDTSIHNDYLKRYLNGDTDALVEYKAKRHGKFYGN